MSDSVKKNTIFDQPEQVGQPPRDKIFTQKAVFMSDFKNEKLP